MENKRKIGTIKILSLLVLVLIMTASMGVIAFCETSEEGFSYDIMYDETIWITGYTGSERILTIPSTINGRRVTNIYSFTTNDNFGLKEITVSEGVTSIGYYAFEDCTSLVNVNLPKSITTIGDSAFCGCISLKKINLSEGVTTIGDSTFENCNSLKEISLPESVITIGDKAFHGCCSLEKIDLSEGVTSIGYGAFINCVNLENIVLPKSLATIEDSAFEGCSKLTEITLQEGLQSLDESLFEDCTSLIKIQLPNSVTSVGTSAFEGCISLEEVIVGKNTTLIGEYAFKDCSKLNKITLQEGLTCIENSVFENCTSLTKIVIPKGVTTIGQFAFSNCSKLNEITLQEGLISIEGAFQNCTSLTQIAIPEGVTSIDMAAFFNCTSLKKASIPKSVTSIGGNAFDGCNSLTILCYKNSTADLYAVDEDINLLFYDFSVNGITKMQYSGKPLKQLGISVIANKNKLVLGTDYEIEYSDNIEVGTGKYTIKCVGDYEEYGNYYGEFQIIKLNINKPIIKDGTDSFIYDGTQKSPDISTSEFYEIYSYSENVNVGVYSTWVSLKDKNNCQWEDGTNNDIKFNWAISKKTIKKPTIKKGANIFTYSGKENSFVIPTSGMYTIKETTKAINAGDYEAFVELKDTNNYQWEDGTTEKLYFKWSITKRSITSYSVKSSLNKTKSTYTGKAIVPVVVVKDGTKALVNNKDYKLEYKNNINSGIATIIIKGIGNYSSEVKKTFTIIPSKVSGLKTASTSAHAIKLSWTKPLCGVNGYELYRYDTKTKTYVKIKTITLSTTTSYTNSKLKSATNYQYKVRAFKIINGVKVYGAFSSTHNTCTATGTPSFKLVSGKKSATVNWTKVNGASSYAVYYKTSKTGNWKLLKSLGADTTTYTKNYLKSNTKYYFTVKAVKKNGTVKGVSGFTTKSVTTK